MTLPAESELAAHIPELGELFKLQRRLGDRVTWRTLCEVPVDGIHLPVKAVSLGTDEPGAPLLLCVGGVHGLERIGSQVVLGFLETLVSRLEWDRALEDMLRHVRLVFLPIVNPTGLWLRRRGTASGVDLMRNAPVEAAEGGWRAVQLYRGQRLAPWLPWYRGSAERLEPESQALYDLLRQEGYGRQFVMSLDVHSGFYGADRLWFPYARTRAPFPHLPEILKLKTLLDESYPRHRYVVEPQSVHYTSHGDLWDYFYDEYRKEQPRGVFLPLTLELGVSSWLKKNPRLLNKLAFFHPLVPHRTRRVLRRHIPLFEFLLRAAYSSVRWASFLTATPAQLR
jgi:hypothetical protein